MNKFLPLILALAVGLGGYIYFNPKVLTGSGIEKVYIYNHDDYKTKKPLPFIKLEKQNLIDIVINTINSSHMTEAELSVTESNYVLDMFYKKDEKETFYLWLNKDTKNAMYQDKNDVGFHIITEDDTSKLKTLIFR